VFLIISYYAQKTIDFQFECGVMCYFPKCVVLQGNHHVKGNNIDICKLESRVGVKHFFFRIFKKHYVAIWSYMLLEDVMQILPFFGATNIC